MEQNQIQKITADLKEKYPDVGIRSVEIDEASGRSTFYLEPTPKTLAFLDKPGAGVIPKQYRERAAVITRDAVSRNNLDLALPDHYTAAPEESFKRAMQYYYTDPLVGTATNLFASLAAKGFENDLDDVKIKQFFDVWAFDVRLEEVLEWIFLDFFKVGHVTTYKVLAKYEPRVSYLSPIPGQTIKKSSTTKKAASGSSQSVLKIMSMLEEEQREYVEKEVAKLKAEGQRLTKKRLQEVEDAAKKNIWSKGHLPVAYTVLNPLNVVIDGNLLFDKTSVKLTPPPELRTLLNKPQSELTEEEKELIKALPSDLKTAAEKGGAFPLDSRLVGSVTYRKQPYERYARPRSARVFDSIEYKRTLRNADLSTLDGITNFILKITIGNDEYPVTDQGQLEAVAQLFNTPSKSFDVVWNHTLNVEKIISPEIGEILGKSKYEQVNEDMTGGLGIPRSIIDGTGEVNAAEIGLLTKGLMEELNYARKQVTRWIYREYQQIAEAMGFDRFPKVRWDDGVLKDTILYMNTLAQLVDRRMLSYQTSLEALGFDYPQELQNMTQEMPLVEEGIFGIVGSPWQQAKSQPEQNAPVGTPSNGRPVGKPAKTKETDTDPKSKLKKAVDKKPSESKPAEASLTTENSLINVIKNMDDATFDLFKQELNKLRLEG